MKIRTFEQTQEGPRSKETELKSLITPKPIPRTSGRIYNSIHSYRMRLAEIFHNNEVSPEKKTTEQIRDQILREYKHLKSFRNRLLTHKETIGRYRLMYNRGVLYSSQPPTWLLSFYYTKFGYIELGGARKKGVLAYFEDCYHYCVNLKVADPRFVPYDYIVEIRNRQNDGIREWLEWIVPTDEEIKNLARKLNVKEVYNSTNFYPGYTREETPIDFEPTDMGA